MSNSVGKLHICTYTLYSREREYLREPTGEGDRKRGRHVLGFSPIQGVEGKECNKEIEIFSFSEIEIFRD